MFLLSRLSVSIRPVWDLYQNKFNIKFYPDYERSCKKTSQIHQLAHINISIYRLIHAQSVATVLSHKCGYRYHQSDATKIVFFSEIVFIVQKLAEKKVIQKNQNTLWRINNRPLAHHGNAVNLEDKTKEHFSSRNWDLFSCKKKSYCSVLQIGFIPTDVQGIHSEIQLLKLKFPHSKLSKFELCLFWSRLKIPQAAV